MGLTKDLGALPRVLTVSGSNVGVGTITPTYRLQVQGSGFAVQGGNLNEGNTIRFLRAGGTEMGYIGWSNESTNNSTWLFRSSNGNPISFSADGINQQVIINTSGNVGIGTTSPQSKLQVVGLINSFASSGALPTPPNGMSIYTGLNVGVINCTRTDGVLTDLYVGAARFNVEGLGTGPLYANGGFLTSTNPSDRRLKEEITDLSYGLNEILQLRAVTYLWKNDKINQGKQFGFIAQEVQEIMPELISEFETKDGEEEVVRLGLDKEAIFVTMVNAIKELTERIKILENK